MIWLIVGLVVGGAVGLVTACMFAARSTSWWRGKAEHMEKLVCIVAKRVPIKVWDESDEEWTPAVRDECMRIIERSYRRDL